MKRILLPVLVIGILSLVACGAPAVTEQPKPATFTISNLSISPVEIGSGRVTFSVLVTNNGDLAGNYGVNFLIDKMMDSTTDVSLAGGEIMKVSFSPIIPYDAATYSVNINGLLATFTRTGAPSAVFTITSIDQPFFGSYINEWSDVVFIPYDVENNGTVDLRYYKVYFTITFDDGSQCQTWIQDYVDLQAGHKCSGEAMGDTGKKKVTSVEIANWELETRTPSEVTYEITGTDLTLYEVVYEITGTAEIVNVTLANATGGTEQCSVHIPRRFLYSSFTDSFLYISAQNQGEYGTVTVSIYINGELFKTSSSSGAYVIATASGSRW